MENYEYSFKVAGQDALIDMIEHLKPEEIKNMLIKRLNDDKITNIQFDFLLDTLREI